MKLNARSNGILIFVITPIFKGFMAILFKLTQYQEARNLQSKEKLYLLFPGLTKTFIHQKFTPSTKTIVSVNALNT